MKKNTLTICLIIFVILAAALLLSVVGLVSAKSEVNALNDLIQTLEKENEALKAQMLANPVQVGSTDESYCTLMVDTWTKDADTLTVVSFAQAILPENTTFSAQMELRVDSVVVASQPVILNPGEADGIFEANVSASFQTPEIGANEQLQLWLVVEPTGYDALSACGADWYVENGQLMLIAG